MTETEQDTHISVRGQAQLTVAPDQASVFGSAHATSGTKATAIADANETLAALVADLSALGGAPLTVQSAHSPLTWSTHSMQTYEEHEHDKRTGAPGPTGQYRSTADVTITVRDFALLGRVEALLAQHEKVDVHSVAWSVDEDHASWATVRANAIQAALAKGQDYATALGGEVTGVEHIADAGLLYGSAPPHQAYAAASRSASLESAGPESTSLDPVPQVLRAIIEARLTASIGPLPAR